ncbi:MAG TPA: hypothetical protein VKQ30_03190 [Ktedonobacterales bacterium]|nr:hypothetical protein [Ktedonobacterales bacterium]
MRGFFDHPLGEWITFGLAAMAFFIAAKYAVSFLPPKGVLGGIKDIVSAA